LEFSQIFKREQVYSKIEGKWRMQNLNTFNYTLWKEKDGSIKTCSLEIKSQTIPMLNKKEVLRLIVMLKEAYESMSW